MLQGENIDVVSASRMDLTATPAHLHQISNI